MASACVPWMDVKREFPAPLTPQSPSTGTTCWFLFMWFDFLVWSYELNVYGKE